MGLPTYACSLATLPTELVHRVVDDLTYLKVLRIAALKDPYLTRCILSHLKCKAALRPATDLSEVNALFQLYQEILLVQTLRIRPKDTSLLNQSVSYDINLGRELHKEIVDLFKGVRGHNTGEGFLQILSPYLTVRPSELYALWNALSSHTPTTTLRRFWTLFSEAERKLNLHKAQQLELAAHLIETFPGKLHLKKPLDLSQGSPRPNTAHIARRLRQDAKKVARDGYLVHRITAHWVYRMHNLPLVPYDRYLVLLLDTIKKHPLPPTLHENNLPGISNLSLNRIHTKTNTNPAQSYSYYPPKTLDDLSTVLSGLQYIYTSPLNTALKNVALATKRTTLKYLPSGKHVHTKQSAFGTAPRDTGDVYKYGLPAHDDREYEWLQAFLRVVEWIEERGEDEEGTKSEDPVA